MFFRARRFARLRAALSETLARTSRRHEPPEISGRDAWLASARSVEDLWNGVEAPAWAVHLAHHTGCAPTVLVDGGTAVLARSLEEHLESLPTVLDYGTIEPQERAVESYFDWKDQPLEDLADGRDRYEAEALEQLSRIQALSERGTEASPYRGSSGWPDELAPRLHRLVAVQHWFAAARLASDPRPKRPAVRDELAVSLAHAFAACPHFEDTLLRQLVEAYQPR